MSDKKHTAASLGHSEELSIKHSPCERIPAVLQQPEEGAKGSPAVLRQNPWDVLPNEPARAKVSHSSNVLEHEPTSLIQEASSLSRDGEGLAGASSDHNVNCSGMMTPIHF